MFPPGTPHTIGPGMVICEVQEYSDLTYRVYDYGRVDAHGKPRELHIEKALDVTEFGRHVRRTRHRELVCPDGGIANNHCLPRAHISPPNDGKSHSSWTSQSNRPSTLICLIILLSGSGDFAGMQANRRISSQASAGCFPASLGEVCT